MNDCSRVMFAPCLRWISKIVYRFAGPLVVLLWCFSETPHAGDNDKLLIVNSDLSVQKYALMQEVFQAHNHYSATVINLADDSPDKASALIQDRRYQIIYTIGTKAYLLAREAAADKNIVFSSVMNWRRLPLTEKSYGIAQELPAMMQLMMFRYLFPDLSKIGVLYSKQFNEEWMSHAENEGREMGVEVIGKDIASSDELIPRLNELLGEVEALWLIADPMVLANKDSVAQIFSSSESQKKPVFAYSEIFIDFGAVLVISADIPTMSRQASVLVDSLVHDSPPPRKVDYPAGSHVILNLKKQKRYPLRLNKEALGSVNQIIE
ncbi:ABC transporter substrate-binding protein [Methylomarinum vadi]|uniref:ABC transporter substrate-binding protein n=1 Tax=Methylomarinum vadi TaxID=438855 RepID=UPI00068BBF3E|nr:ABC transporter substrate binding protein [Methylomarinum vadi]